MGNKFPPWILYVLLVIILSLVYGFTLAPGYTWANRAADAGDLITAAYTGGVAHPPGYPTYLLLARLFQFLPVGTLAFRTNLLSAVCGLLTALLVMDLTRRLSPGQTIPRLWAGLLAGLAFGLSPLFWSQVVITEVYTLHVLFIALILWLMFVPLTDVRLFSKVGLLSTATWRERLISLLFGLGLGNQLTIVLLMPAWLLFNRDTARIFYKVDRPRLVRRLGWVVAGALVYLTIPLRARGDSPVNWGSADDLRGFWWLVSGQLYQGELFSLDWAEFVGRLGEWAVLLTDQFGWIGLALSLYGLASIWHRKALAAVTLWMGAAYSVFALVYAVEDYYVLLLPFFLATSLWLGAGAARLLGFLRSWRGRGGATLGFLLLLGGTGLNAAQHFNDVDASRDQRAVTFAQDALTRVPQDGLVMTAQDDDTFVLWYYHYALGHRPDLILLHDGLLDYDWYRQAMLAYYPDLVLPSSGWDCLVCAVKDVPRLNQRPYCQVKADGSSALLCW